MGKQEKILDESVIGRWVILELYGQKPIAGLVKGVTYLGGILFYFFMTPRDLHDYRPLGSSGHLATFDVRALAKGTAQSMRFLDGELDAAWAFNQRQGHPGRRVRPLDLAPLKLPEPLSQRGLN